jgi:Cu2+-exporting ATPase
MLSREFCCAGCQAVAETIVSGGLESYYRDRDAPAAGPAALPEGLTLEAFDHPEAQREFVGREGELACAELTLDAINCAACAWLIERRLQQDGSVARATVNLSNHRLHLVWDDKKTPYQHVAGQFGAHRLSRSPLPGRQSCGTC